MKIPAVSPPSGVMVVDDDAELAGTLKEFLEQEGYAVEVALSAADAILIQERRPNLHIALIDLVMPVSDGITLTEELRRRNPGILVVIMTGYGTIESAVEAIKRGAEDYLTKPFDYETVRKKVARLMEVFELRERVEQLESNLEAHPCFENFVYVSPVMQKVVDRVRAVAASDTPVLLLGETGTGKEMLARAIHASSRRSRGPFIPINCGALPRELVESELFGVRRGAFTGANADAPGIFAAASGGTVFLDEIGDMPKEIQVKLLRVLQEGEVRPVGGSAPFKVDVRVISAANAPLAALRGENLRRDLFFRISTVVVEIPPLRERPDDVLVLAQHFANRLGRRYNRSINLSPSALEPLLTYSFVGNVRELENLLESAAVFSQDDPQTITDQDLKALLCTATPFPSPSTGSEPVSIKEVEQTAIERALRLCEGNRTKAASLLGISRDTLYRKMRQMENRPE